MIVKHENRIRALEERVKATDVEVVNSKAGNDKKVDQPPNSSETTSHHSDHEDLAPDEV